MWFKLFLLLLYFLLLFVLSRLLEVVSWYDGTSSLFTNSRNLLDPVTLSVKKLKQLLDNRGVNYSWALEKKELIQLVAASGSPVKEEVTTYDVPSHQTTHFSCGSHFYEEVEDTKDSIWLVQVASGSDDNTILDESTWKEVISQVAKFGVRTGVFRCSLDKSLCDRKRWVSPRLILALPQSCKAKEDVTLYNYLRASKATSVVNWVRTLLASRIKKIQSDDELTQKWLGYESVSKKSEIRLILFSELNEPPLFLSSLAVKFTGRVKFGTVPVHRKNAHMYKKIYGDTKLPVYFIVTPEKTFKYGAREGEIYSYRDMEVFLKSLHPEMNDIFLWSLLLTNAVVGFEIFLTSGKLWKRLVRYVICIVKYNCFMFLAWLLILTLYRFSFMDTITDFSLKLTRLINATNASAVLRNDWENVWSYHFLIGFYFFFGSVTSFILRKIGRITVIEDIAFFSDWWTLPCCSFITSCFFRPMTTRPQSVTTQELDLIDGLELLIERLAVPNLWLQPIISTDYIKDLPVWKYRGWCEADDDEAEQFDVTSSSEDEVMNSSSEGVNASNGNSPDTAIMCSNISASNSSSSERKSVNRTFFENFFSRGNPIASPKCQAASTCDNLPVTGRSEKCLKYPNQPYGSALSSSNYQPHYLTEEQSPASDIQRAPLGMLEFRECSICIESYRYGERLCGLPCGHNYHMNCIMSWLYRDNHCCPICRRPSYKSKSRLVHLHLQ